MKRLVTVGPAVLVSASFALAQEDVPPFLKTTWDTTRVRQEMKGKAADMMASFWFADRTHRDGMGYSDRASSGGLGWGESSWLMNYIMCYQAFRDTYWLDKVVDHFDRMMGSLTDPEGDSYLAWRDVKYSVGIVRVTAKRNTDGLTIEPDASRLWVIRHGGDKVAGHRYSVTFPAADKLEVKDETDGTVISALDYKDRIVLTGVPPKKKTGKVVLNGIPGAKFTISGPAKPGARFEFESIPGEEIEYQVHDGMITYPIAQFIEIVYGDPSLHGKYKRKADAYLAFIEKHMLEKWEPTWVELPKDSGAYVFTKHVTQRFPGGLLPHNQFLAPARTFLVLKDVKGIPKREVYLEKATKMARYLKQHLRLNGTAYVWNYWDPYPEIPTVRRYVEDTGHGTIDIGFVCEACNRNVVFTTEDLVRFSNTYADVMWNQSKDDPIIAGRVDGSKTRRDGRTLREYAKLAQWNPKVWDLALGIQTRYPAASNAPTVLYIAAGMAGTDGEEIAAFHRLRADLEKAAADGIPFNGDFEMGAPGRAPCGWSFGVWSKSKGGGSIVKGGHNSKQAICLEGIPGEAGNINVVAMPRLRTKVSGPTRFRMSVTYRTEGGARPFFSFLGYDGESPKAAQYDNSPPLEPSTDWKRTAWEAASKDGVKESYFVLRNNGAGKVFYDDFEMVRLEGDPQ